MHIFKNILNFVKKYLETQKTITELQKLSDRELHDIGLNRSDIGYIKVV